MINASFELVKWCLQYKLVDLIFFKWDLLLVQLGSCSFRSRIPAHPTGARGRQSFDLSESRHLRQHTFPSLPAYANTSAASLRG